MPMPVTDVSPALWITRELTGFGAVVGNLVPASYPRFVRVLHRPDQGLPDAESPSSWAEVAARHQTTLHPQAEYDVLAATEPASGVRAGEPLQGSLDRMTLPALRDVLARHTETADQCWFGLWHGFGSSPSDWAGAPTFRLPGREYLLFTGSLASVVDLSSEFHHAGLEQVASRGELDVVTTEPGRMTVAQQIAIAREFRRDGSVQSPSLWWPQDRAWFVASEIDLDSTIVAGTHSLIVDLLADPMIEALEVTSTTSLVAGADEINQGPGQEFR